jgi:hypothetical protein
MHSGNDENGCNVQKQQAEGSIRAGIQVGKNTLRWCPHILIKSPEEESKDWWVLAGMPETVSAQACTLALLWHASSAIDWYDCSTVMPPVCRPARLRKHQAQPGAQARALCWPPPSRTSILTWLQAGGRRGGTRSGAAQRSSSHPAMHTAAHAKEHGTAAAKRPARHHALYHRPPRAAHLCLPAARCRYSAQ